MDANAIAVLSHGFIVANSLACLRKRKRYRRLLHSVTATQAAPAKVCGDGFGMEAQRTMVSRGGVAFCAGGAIFCSAWGHWRTKQTRQQVTRGNCSSAKWQKAKKGRKKTSCPPSRKGSWSTDNACTGLLGPRAVTALVMMSASLYFLSALGTFSLSPRRPLNTTISLASSRSAEPQTSRILSPNIAPNNT